MTATRAAAPTHAAVPSDKRATAPPARHDTASTNVPTSAPAVMRKGACACGGGCPRCANKVPLQAKLRVSQPHDPLEQEADQVAEQIMRMSAATGAGENNSPSVTSAGGMAAGGMEVNSQMTDALASRRSYGVPLSSDARGFFEPRFGSSLGSVRIHNDVPAQEMAESVNARAFTLGQDIYYAAGQFDTASTGGLRLLAHELTHTVQQGNHVGVLQREGEEDEETAEEAYDPRREILSLSAFARRYPEIMRRYNDLEQQMDELDQDVAAYGPVGFEFSELQARYARVHERWSAATAVLDEYWGIARVMVAAARATQVLVVVNDMRRAQLAAGRSGFGAIEFSPLTTPHQRTLRVRNLLNTALAERPETARVHEAVGEEIERASTAREHDSAPALRSVAETVGDLRAYVLANFHGISAGDGRLRYAMGIANLLHVNLGDTAASYVELFSRLESENLEFYTLILFRGATIGYLQDMGVAGLAEHVYRDADRAGAHMLLGAWDFDEATGEERDSPTWTLLLDVLVGIIPFAGQVADVRDITGYIYRIGKYPAQRTNPWTWVGAVGTLIGLIPAAGDAAKSLLSAVRRAVTEVPVGRLSDDIVAAATRHVDGATLARFLDATDDLGRSLTVRWTVIQGNALNAWDRILAELGPVLVRVSDLTQAELNLVRRAAAEHLPEGFRLAGAWLGQLVQSLWVTARLTARHEAEDIIAMIREFRETWTLTSEAAQQLWSPTARFLANLEPAERAAVRSNLLELAARESDEIAQGVRRMLGEESESTSRVVTDSADAAPPARAPTLESAALDDAVVETETASARPPTSRVGRSASMRHGEMLEIFTRALRRPGPGSEVYRVYDSIETYDDAWRAASGDLMGDVPQGFVHRGLIHLPPNASSLTVLHESLHWASNQSGARTLLGQFAEEGLVESIARRIAGPEAGEVYEANIRFVDELARAVGQDVLDNALLHGQWGSLRRALNAHFDSAARTQEFYMLLRRIDGNGEPQELVDRARRMLGGLADDATLPAIRVPDTPDVSTRPPVRAGDLPEGTDAIADELPARIRVLDPLAALASLARTHDPHEAYVYRILNSEGEVIYYGISTHPIERLRRHAATQGWADEIHGIEVINQAFRRPQALALETDLIRAAFAQGVEIYNEVDDTISQALGSRGGSFAGEIDVPRPSAPWTRIGN